ncbi:MAG: hypothetical protein V1851_02210 [Patescibacteria group bacterium]
MGKCRICQKEVELTFFEVCEACQSRHCVECGCVLNTHNRKELCHACDSPHLVLGRPKSPMLGSRPSTGFSKIIFQEYGGYPWD